MKRKIFIQTISLFLSIILLMTISSAQDWPTYNVNNQRTGYSNSDGPENNNILWQSEIITWFESSPVIVDDKIYIGSTGEGIFCFNLDGTENWVYQTDDWISSIPAVSNNKIVFGCWDNNVYCLDTNGNLEWIFHTENWVKSSPAIYNGHVYITSLDGNLYCINLEDGSEQWSYPGVSGICTPAIYNNNIFVGNNVTIDIGKILCINSESGELVWYSDLGIGDLIISAAAIYNDYLYTGSFGFSDNPKLFCLNISNNGEIEWEYDIDGFASTKPVVDNNYVYIATQEWDFDKDKHVGKLLCIDKNDQSLLWEFSVDDPIKSTPVVTDEKLYFGCNDDFVYCLDKSNGLEIWSYDTGVDVVSSPAIYNNKLYIAGKEDGTIYCFGENSVPPTPNQPSGETDGNTGVDYSFSTNVVIDSDGDDVSYFFKWGDGTNSGWITSPTTSHSWSQASTYNIAVKTRDIYGYESSWSEPLSVDISGLVPYTPSLIISTQESVEENSIFEISVLADDNAIEDVLIEFAGSEYYTDEKGMIEITSPEVDEDKLYLIEASKDGYVSDLREITITNMVDLNEGYLYGSVFDRYGEIIKDAKLYIYLSENEYEVIYTENGDYVLTLDPGKYDLRIEKQGYKEIVSEGIVVEKDTATGKNFILEKFEEPKHIDDNEKIISYTIQEKAKAGKIGAEVRIDQQNYVYYYDDKLNIDVTKDDNLISCTVEAEEADGKVIAFYLGEGSLDDYDNLVVTYDSFEIEKATDVTSFFDFEESDNPTYLEVKTDAGVYVLIQFTHFSSHTITISSSVVEALAFSIAVLLFIVVCMIGALAFIWPVAFVTFRTKKIKNK